MSKTVLLVYGSGGHNEEMIRLYKQMNTLLTTCGEDVKFISLCDDDVKHIVTTECVVIPSITDKFSYFKLIMKIPFVGFKTFRILSKLDKKENIDFMITTGPGIGALVGLYFKFKKTKIITIETASRFYSKSLGARALYFLADYFMVQNEELLKLYDKAIFKGRL